MPITPDEMIDIGSDAYELALFLQKSLKVDADGKKRLDKDEMKVFLKEYLLPMSAKLTRDLID
jgi:hypothetical protein